MPTAGPELKVEFKSVGPVSLMNVLSRQAHDLLHERGGFHPWVECIDQRVLLKLREYSSDQGGHHN